MTVPNDDSFTEHADRQDRWVNRSPVPCPECGAQYPVFTSPPGQLGHLCEGCGYTSPDYLPPGHPGRQPSVTELRRRLEGGDG